MAEILKIKKIINLFYILTNEKNCITNTTIKGSHQIDNATVAITALRKLKCRKKSY